MQEWIIGLSYGLVILNCFVFFVRNNQVYRFTGRLIETWSNVKDSSWVDRRLEYTQVSYNKMVLMFWKPLTSFYEGTELLRLYRERYEKK